MAAFHLLTVGDKELKLKINNQYKVEAEKKLGMSLIAAMEHIDQAEVFAIALWAALQKYHHGYTMQKVYLLIDEMEEDDFVIEDKGNLYMEIMKVSGFFKQAQIAEMEEQKAREEAQEMEEV